MKTRKISLILTFLMAIAIMSYLIVGVTPVYAEEASPTSLPNSVQTCEEGMTYSEELNNCVFADESSQITIIKVNDNQSATMQEAVANKPNYGRTNETWAIVNFICASVGLLIAMASFLLKTHREQINEQTLFVKYYERKKTYMYCNLFIAICSIALFIITQRITDSMVLFDEFSGMFLFYAIANLAIYFAYCKWSDATSIYE